MTAMLFRDDAYLRSCDARVMHVGQDGIRLDRTVFYPNGGGQPGDTGLLRRADGSAIEIVNTVKGPLDNDVLHIAAPGGVELSPGETVAAEIDWARRHLHMRYHTALHLMCAAVPAPVTGGQISADKARLDFDIDMALLDKDAIEAKVNALIEAAHPVSSRWVDEAELDANPGLVRTMSVAPPRGQGTVRLIEVAGADLQPCGGTHVRNTAEIGRFAVQKIRSEGKQNKRVIIVLES
ncbi:MAG: alanyl-tRNA editing protein [Burkholderiales bacterium]|nr:alanyl-tRNA editing protein [Burkholderiales bacterium]